MKLHANSNQMIDEYKNIELQKKCKSLVFYPGELSWRPKPQKLESHKNNPNSATGIKIISQNHWPS